MLFDNIIIECDGPQHFLESVRIQHFKMTNEETLERDIYKMKKIIDNNSIIRLFQPDVYSDKFDWKQFIMKTINFIKIYKESKLYISFKHKDIYKDHVKNFQTIVFN
jgi:hypothetical protein